MVDDKSEYLPLIYNATDKMITNDTNTGIIALVIFKFCVDLSVLMIILTLLYKLLIKPIKYLTDLIHGKKKGEEQERLNKVKA